MHLPCHVRKMRAVSAKHIVSCKPRGRTNLRAAGVATADPGKLSNNHNKVDHQNVDKFRACRNNQRRRWLLLWWQQASKAGKWMILRVSLSPAAVLAYLNICLNRAIKTFQMKDPTERTTPLVGSFYIAWMVVVRLSELIWRCYVRLASVYVHQLERLDYRRNESLFGPCIVGCKHRTKVPLAGNGLRRPAGTLSVNVANLDIYEYVTWLPQRHQAEKYPYSTLASCIYRPVLDVQRYIMKQKSMSVIQRHVRGNPDSMLLLCECM